MQAILSDCVTKIETSRGTLHKASRILSGVVHKYRVGISLCLVTI